MSGDDSISISGANDHETDDEHDLLYEEKDYTLVFLRKIVRNVTVGDNDDKSNANIDKMILLGMKLRGFGIGKWNGFGGKIETGETIEQGAIREVHEECGITVLSLHRVGYIVFKMKLDRKIMKVHVFESYDYTGDAITSDEMRPQWYNENELPFTKMWPDDKYWMPYLLAGKMFLGRFEYSDDDTIVDYSLKEQ